MSIVSTPAWFCGTRPIPRCGIATRSASATQSRIPVQSGSAVHSGLARWVGALLLLALAVLTSACGSSSRSFGEFGTASSPATLTSISVEPANSNLPLGLTRQFSAVAIYSNGTKLDVSSSVTWSSSSTNTATITPTGVLAAVGLGAVTVTAASGAVTGSTTLTVSAASLVSIDVTPGTPTITKGGTQQLTATGIYTDYSTQNITTTVTWSSSNALVATISNAPGTVGLATGVNGGTSTMTATLGAATGSTVLTVSGAVLLSINVTPVNPRIALGTRQQFAATGVYSDGTQQVLTTTVTWRSSGAAATISNVAGSQGVATAAAVGTTTISAAGGGITGFTTLTVGNASLLSIAVTPANPSIIQGLTQAFVATGAFSDGTHQVLTATVTWSSASAAATISNAAGSQGVATAVAAGTVVITATAGAITGSTTLTVVANTLVSIAVTPANPLIPAGLTQAFVATGTYSNGTSGLVTASAVWRSTITTVASISNAATTSGTATGLTAGTTVITATVGTIVSPPVTLTVTAATLVSIAVSPINPTIVNGATLQFIATGTYTDGTMIVITNAVTWTSGTQAVATISNVVGPPSTQGIATAVSVGRTLITATYPGTTPIMSPSQTLTVINAFAYATNTGAAVGQAGSISQYSIGQDGTLTALATVPAGYFAFSIVISPSGLFAYVANYNKSGNPQNSTISQYAISADGTLTSIGTPVVTESNPNSVTIDPFGKYVYVSNNGENTVSEFVVQANGTLANPPGVVGIGGQLFPSGLGPASIAIDRGDTFAYVANYGDGTVSQYAIGLGGALATIAGKPPSVNAQTAPGYVIIDPTGPYVYVANEGSNTISEYNIGGDGSLTPETTPFVATGGTPTFIAIDPTGHYAYVADSTSDDVSQYTIVNGILIPMAVPNVLTGLDSAPYGLTIDATGKYLYVAERITMGVIAQFAINPADGSLMPFVPLTAPAGASPTSIVTTPNIITAP